MGNTKSKFQENHKLSKRDLKVLQLIHTSQVSLKVHLSIQPVELTLIPSSPLFKCILETILVHEVHQKYPKYAFKDIEYSVELLKIKVRSLEPEDVQVQ